MATEVTSEETITTQEGTELTVKPLTIRSLRKFMEIINELNDHQKETERAEAAYSKALSEHNEAVQNGEDVGEPPTPPEEDEFAVIDIMLKAAKISLEKHNPEFAADHDRLEDELDMNVLNQILETAGGIKLGDPNLSGTPTAKA